MIKYDVTCLHNKLEFALNFEIFFRVFDKCKVLYDIFYMVLCLLLTIKVK